MKLKLSKNVVQYDYKKPMDKNTIKGLINDEFSILDEEWWSEFSYDAVEIIRPLMCAFDIVNFLEEIKVDPLTYSVKQLNSEKILIKIWD